MPLAGLDLLAPSESLGPPSGTYLPLGCPLYYIIRWSRIPIREITCRAYSAVTDVKYLIGLHRAGTINDEAFNSALQSLEPVAASKPTPMVTVASGGHEELVRQFYDWGATDVDRAVTAPRQMDLDQEKQLSAPRPMNLMGFN